MQRNIVNPNNLIDDINVCKEMINMPHNIAIPYIVIDDMNATNRRKVLRVANSRLHYLQTHKDTNNYTLAQIKDIITDLIARYTTYHGENMPFASYCSYLSKGIDLKSTYISMSRHADMYTGGDTAKSIQFKNKMQNNINHISNEKLYVYTIATLSFTLANKADTIQYLRKVVQELEEPGSYINE